MAHPTTLKGRYPVHAVVSKTKFPSDLHYDAVFQQPALLVSHLIRTPQAVHFFLAIIRAAPELSQLKRDSKRAKGYVYPEAKNVFALNRSDRALVKKTLKQVAKTLTWGVEAMPAYGKTVCKAKTAHSARRHYSANSQMYISEVLYRAVLEEQGGDVKLALQFLMSVTMLHELAHATMYALTDLTKEPTFGPSGVGEAGWELEARIFGLCPSVKSRSEELWSLWWHEVGTSQDTQGSYLQRPIERVQIEYIKELFTDGFWQHRIKELGMWVIIPSAAWPPVVFVPESIAATIQNVTKITTRTPIAKVTKPSKKRKRSDEDDEDK